VFLFTGKKTTPFYESYLELIVVNSKRGISRSATIVVGYIMYTEGLSYTEAVKDVRTKRKIRIAAAQFRELLKDIGCTKNRKKTRGATSLPPLSPLDHSLLPEKEDANPSNNVNSPPLTSDASVQPREDSDIVDSPPLPSDPPPEKEEINNVK